MKTRNKGVTVRLNFYAPFKSDSAIWWGER